MRRGVVIMNNNELLRKWLNEEKLAYIHGWDFSHIEGRFESDDLPWNYENIVRGSLGADTKLLDIDTGGGEFLLSLNHPYQNTAATEAYPPNVELCRDMLIPLGIDFKEADGNGRLPYANNSFDLVINRHGSFNAEEIYRVLKTNGSFITQQVGAENDRDLVKLLLGDIAVPFGEQYLFAVQQKFEAAGFTITRGEEAFCPIKFWDVGALVWFARIIQWEFPDFSVNSCLENLFAAQKILEHNGVIEGKSHRFILIAKK